MWTFGIFLKFSSPSSYFYLVTPKWLTFINWFFFQLSYILRSKGNLPSASERTNDGSTCRPTEDNFDSEMAQNGEIHHCNPTNYYFSGFLSLQAAIDLTWIVRRWQLKLFHWKSLYFFLIAGEIKLQLQFPRGYSSSTGSQRSLFRR